MIEQFARAIDWYNWPSSIIVLDNDLLTYGHGVDIARLNIHFHDHRSFEKLFHIVVKYDIYVSTHVISHLVKTS